MSADKPRITHYTQHGAHCAERGEIDQNTATALVRKLVWQSNDQARKLFDRFTPLHGFVDETGACLEVAPNGDTGFYVHLELPVEKQVLLLKYRRWRWRTSSLCTIEDVASVVKLFFAGRRRVVDDLLKAYGPPEKWPPKEARNNAEANPPPKRRQSA